MREWFDFFLRVWENGLNSLLVSMPSDCQIQLFIFPKAMFLMFLSWAFKGHRASTLGLKRCSFAAHWCFSWQEHQMDHISARTVCRSVVPDNDSLFQLPSLTWVFAQFLTWFWTSLWQMSLQRCSGHSAAAYAKSTGKFGVVATRVKSSQIESNRVKSSQIESNCEEYIISIFQFLRVCLESNSEYSLAPFTEAIVTSGPGLTNMVTPMQAHPYACLELFRYV